MGESIFDQYKEKKNLLIKNRNYLSSSYIPEQLPHRENNIKEIAEIIAPSLRKDKPSNILITGKTGTGKTAVLNYIGKELKKADENETNCCFVYINCEVVDTAYGMLYNISNQIIKEDNRRFPFTGWALDRVFNELTTYIDEQDKVYIIVLDEVDKAFQKNGDDIFYFLTTINEVLKKSKVSVISITNNTHFTELIQTKIKSRLGDEKIIFKPYTPPQMIDILQQRAAIAFEPNVLDQAVIPLCSAISAQDSGDARRALDLLRISAEIAERNGDIMITEAHVNSARVKIELDAVIEIIKTLTVQSKLVLMSIIKNSNDENNKMITGEVYTTYKEICNILGWSAVTQRRVAGLISELDMLGIVHARVKSFGRYGNTKQIELNISKDIIDMVSDDDLFKPLKNYKPSKQTTLM